MSGLRSMEARAGFPHASEGSLGVNFKSWDAHCGGKGGAAAPHQQPCSPTSRGGSSLWSTQDGFAAYFDRDGSIEVRSDAWQAPAQLSTRAAEGAGDIWTEQPCHQTGARTPCCGSGAPQAPSAPLGALHQFHNPSTRPALTHNTPTALLPRVSATPPSCPYRRCRTRPAPGRPICPCGAIRTALQPAPAAMRRRATSTKRWAARRRQPMMPLQSRTTTAGATAAPWGAPSRLSARQSSCSSDRRASWRTCWP